MQISDPSSLHANRSKYIESYYQIENSPNQIPNPQLLYADEDFPSA